MHITLQSDAAPVGVYCLDSSFSIEHTSPTQQLIDNCCLHSFACLLRNSLEARCVPSLSAKSQALLMRTSKSCTHHYCVSYILIMLLISAACSYDAACNWPEDGCQQRCHCARPSGQDRAAEAPLYGKVQQCIFATHLRMRSVGRCCQ
jgi:hypothetical protein